jgi:hypothetical protein
MAYDGICSRCYGRRQYGSRPRAGDLAVLRDVVQPFPTFSEIYGAALKVLRGQIAAASQSATAGSPGLS